MQGVVSVSEVNCLALAAGDSLCDAVFSKRCCRVALAGRSDTLVIVIATLLFRGTSLGFVGASSLIVLSPTLVVPIATEVAAERRLYLVLAAVVPWVVAVVLALLSRISTITAHAAALNDALPLRLTLAGALCLAGCCSVLDMRRVAVYADEVTLWSDAERHQPDNSLVQINLETRSRKQGTPRRNPPLRGAIELDPNFLAHESLAGALAAVGRLDESKEHYEQAIRLAQTWRLCTSVMRGCCNGSATTIGPAVNTSRRSSFFPITVSITPWGNWKRAQATPNRRGSIMPNRYD